MKTSDCIDASKRNLADARRYLESGEAVSWVADSLGHAILWAMEGWLIAQGHKISHGNGWLDTRVMFLKNGPIELRSQLTNLLSQTSYLEFDLMGGIEGIKRSRSMDEWKTKAFACLEKTEEAVQHLLAYIGPDNA